MVSRFINKSPDYDAMRQFYDATGGRDKWSDGTGWMNGKGLRGWKGVKLNEAGRVKELILKGNTCTGPIPSAIGNLKALTVLYLSRNNLTGSIPPDIGNLSELTSLALRENELTGTIPSAIGNLKALTKLYLSGNNLTGYIHPTMGDLSVLLELSLSRNKLSGSIPPDIGRLSELTYLALRENELTGPIPSAIGNLKALTGLYLSRNNLTGSIPPEIGNLSELTYLTLRENKLTGPIPSAIGNLKALTVLHLLDNNLTGSIPRTLGDLSVLLELSLSRNKLSGPIPSAIGNLKALTRLYLAGNNLTGSIPRTLGGLSVLLELDLSINKLSGSIPPEIGNLSKLTSLALLKNELIGDLPVSFSNLASLKELNCQQRDGFIISGGPIPDESMDTWRLRLKSRDRRSSPTTLVTHSAEAAMERIDNSPVPSQSQLVLPSELLRLTRENRAMLDEVMELTNTNSATFDAMPQAESLRELGRLVGMAKHLEEIVASKIEDDDMEQRERSLVQDSMEKAHYITLKNGLCNAYLASCVVCSKLVSTSQTGTMGTAGKALKFIAGVTPVLGGLASGAAAALKSRDHYVQTQRVIKIAGMASDVVECSKIAKRVAMKITEGLAFGDIITRGAGDEKNIVRGIRATSGEEAVRDAFDCFKEASNAGNRSDAVKEGKHFGEKHLCMLLEEIESDCLSRATDTDAKVETLAAVVLQRAVPHAGVSEQAVEQRRLDDCTAEALPVVPSSGKAVRESCQRHTASQSNVEASRARVEAMGIEYARRIEDIERKHTEIIEAFKAAEAKHAGEIEALRRKGSDIRKTVAWQNEVEAMKIKHAEDIKALKRQFSTLRKKVEKVKENDKDKEISGAVDAGDHGSMTPDEVKRLQREKIVMLEEKLKMTEDRVDRLEASLTKKQIKIAQGKRKK